MNKKKLFFFFKNKSINLKISNILGTFTTIILTLPQGLEGAKVTRIRTLERYIDNTNFTGGQILLENGSNLLLEDGNESRFCLTPPMRPFQEEKLSLALFHHPILEDFWKENLPKEFS